LVRFSFSILGLKIEDLLNTIHAKIRIKSGNDFWKYSPPIQNFQNRLQAGCNPILWQSFFGGQTRQLNSVDL
jgi:hypothetical protein